MELDPGRLSCPPLTAKRQYIPLPAERRPGDFTLNPELASFELNVAPMKLTSLVSVGFKLATHLKAQRGLALAFSAIACVASSVVPVSLQAAQTYTWQNVVTDGGGGFVPGIIFNPTERNLIYARTDIGGAYRWEQSTKRWIPLLDWLSTSDWNLNGVVTLATDPVEPNRLYIGAGTYTNIWTSQNGAILRSTDRGNTFQRTDLPFKLGGNMPGRNIGERLAVDPHKNSILYLGAPTGNGLWKSTDFGVTWSKVTSFPNPGTFAQVPGDVYQGDASGIGWITFDPNVGTAGSASPNIYVGVIDKPLSVYRSTDGGVTWAALAGQPTNFFSHHGTIMSNGMMYLTFSDTQGPYDGGKGDVWKFNTKNDTWTLISPIPSTDAGDYFGYGGLATDAQHPDTLMVASLNSWWPDAIIFRSINGGTTWTRIWDWAIYPARTLRYIQDITSVPWLNLATLPAPPVPSPKLGWMIDGMAIDPFDSNRMMYGTGLTLYGTENLTAWDAGGQFLITPMAKGFEETAVTDLISPPAGPSLVSAMGDIGGFRHDSLTTAPSTVFLSPNFTSSTGLDFAELMPNFMVRTGNSTTIKRIVFSFDGGADWFQGNSEPGGVSGGGDVAANANATIVLWSPPGAVVSFSPNNGNSWTSSIGIPAAAAIASDRVNPTKFYGLSTGVVYVSTNGAANFTPSAATGLPASGQIKAVPGREGDIWVAGGSTPTGIWHSTDSGVTFTKLSNVDAATNIGFGKAAPGQAYPALFSSATIGGVQGIYRSDDVGATWIRINDNQHQYPTSGGGAITGDPRVYGRVYVGTNGRGIIYGELSGTATPDFALSAAPSSLTVARGTTVTSTISVGALSGFSGTVALAASGLPTGVTAAFSPLSAAGTSTVTLTANSTATTGLASITVTGTSGALSHTTGISLMVTAPATADFSLSTTPATVTVAQGAIVTSTVTVAPLNGFAGSVALAATGLPTGVTASFSPASTTGASTLTLSASSTAAAGPATITVTGTSGTLTHSASISVTVTATAVANFSLSAAPATVTVARGASGTSTVTVNKLNGFVASVALSATGLPAGVTASFSPVSATGSSVLTLATTATAAAGTSSITVTGTSGTLTHTATITLVVVPVEVADFNLTATPAAVAVTRGATAVSTVTVNKINGFAGSVALTITGLPTGVTATFSPASTTGTSTLTFSATSAAVLGAATATISGTGTPGTHTTAITLTVSDVGTLPCSLPTTITLPFSQNGTGEFCWVTSGTVNFINSWNTQLIEVNGVAFTNKWSNSLPPRINGNYYIHYIGAFAWSHFEITGTP